MTSAAFAPATIESLRAEADRAAPLRSAVARASSRTDGVDRTGAPPISTAAELLARTFIPIRWLVPGLLPEGLTLLAARPKIGKSWLALDLAIATATGGGVLGRRVERGAVLYLALEDSDRRMHARLLKLGATGQGLGDLAYSTTWPRGAAGARAIREWIDRTPQARLVVVDVFAKLRDHPDGRETAYAADYQDVAALKPPPERPVSVLLVHHTRKAESDDPLDTISGTLGIGGAADGAWVLKRARGEDEAELHVVGRDLEAEGAYSVRFNRDACRWELVGDAWRVKISGERREILGALERGAARPKEIATEVGKTEGAVRFLLHRMAAEGQVDRGLDGRYRAIRERENSCRA